MTILVRPKRGFWRSLAQTSNPLMSGRCTSRKIRSGSSASACASAVSPSHASFTLMRPSSSVRRTRSTTCGSSSAMRIVSIASFRGKRDARRIGPQRRVFSGENRRGRPARGAVCPPRQAAAGALLDLDGALHGGMQTADVLVVAGRGERLRVTLALEKHRRALLARREGDLVGRVVGVGPRHVLTGADRELARSKGEAGDPDIARARLHRDGATRRLAAEPGKRDHVVLLSVRLVALEARLVVRLVVELLIRGERRVFPLAVPDVVRVLGAPPRALLHDRDADEVALDEAPVGILHRVPRGIHLGLVLNQCEYRAARDGLALANRLQGLGGAVQLTVLLVVVAIDRGIEHVILVIRRKRDPLGPGSYVHRGQGQGERD